MADWIHCNECLTRLRSDLKFFLTECGHLYCTKCVQKIMHVKTCSICKKSTTVLQLSKGMDLNILEFFMPIEALLKKACEVIQFQTQHRSLLFNALIKKYNYVKKESMNSNNTIKRLMRENHELKAILGGSNGSNAQYVTSTPASQKSSNLFHNNSMLSSIPPVPGYGSADNRQRNPHLAPGYARRMFTRNGFESVSSHGPSPAQIVPTHSNRHQPFATYSLEELRRSGGKSK